MNIDELAHRVCSEIPEGWEIRVVMKKGKTKGFVEAYRPDGEFFDAGWTNAGIEADIASNLEYVHIQELLHPTT